MQWSHRHDEYAKTPIEALKRAYHMRVLRYRLRRGSGGRGLAPVGEVIERDLQMLEDVTVSLITERRVSRLGGSPAGISSTTIWATTTDPASTRRTSRSSLKVWATRVKPSGAPTSPAATSSANSTGYAMRLNTSGSEEVRAGGS